MSEVRDFGSGGQGSDGRAQARSRAHARVPPRLLFPTGRSDLRVSWHQQEDVLVLSLWHDDVCVGSAPLSPAEAAEMASFVVTQLGNRPRSFPRAVPGDAEAPTRARGGVAAWLRALRGRVLGFSVRA